MINESREGSRLTIPEEARGKAAVALATYMSCDPGQSRWYEDHAQLALEAAGPLMVAAELERLADEISGDLAPPPHPYWVERHDDGALTAEMVRQVDRIEARAAELRGGEPQ